MNYEIILVDPSTGDKGRVQTKNTTIDFLALNLGPDKLSVMQGGSGSAAYFEFGARALRSAFVPQNDADLVNLVTLKNAIAGLQTGAKWRDPVITILSTPPVSPAEGDRYLIPSTDTATGAWAGHEKDIAVYKSGGWTFETPVSGWTLRVLDRLNQIWQFEASDWGYGQYESTTASNGCKKVGFDIQRDDTEMFTNGTASAIGLNKIGYVKSDGNIGLASKENASLGNETLFVMCADASVNPDAEGAFTVRPGGTIKGMSGLLAGKLYYLDMNGNMALYGDVTWNVNDKVICLGKALSTSVFLYAPSYEYTILN